MALWSNSNGRIFEYNRTHTSSTSPYVPTRKWKLDRVTSDGVFFKLFDNKIKDQLQVTTRTRQWNAPSLRRTVKLM